MQEMVEEISEIPANDDGVTSPDQSIVLPAYVPTIEETIKASGAHRSLLNTVVNELVATQDLLWVLLNIMACLL